MTHDVLRRYARMKPFRPFRLVLTTGTVLDVRRRDQIMLGNTSVVVGISDWPGGTTIDHTVQVDYVTIAAAEVIV